MSLKQALLCVKSKSDYPYQTELSELLKDPKDIIDAVEQSKETGDHAEIHRILTNRNINLSKILLSKPQNLCLYILLHLICFRVPH